jgi:hypothetical protein
MRYVELRRHTDYDGDRHTPQNDGDRHTPQNDGDRHTPQGAAEAEVIG